MVLFTDRITLGIILRDALALALLYAAGIWLLPRAVLIEFMNGMMAALAFTVSFVYVLDLPDRARAGISGPLLIRIGITGSWLMTGLVASQRLYFMEFRPGTVGRAFDIFYGAPAAGFILFAGLHLVAIGMQGNRFIKRYVSFTALALFGGAAMIGLVKFLHWLSILNGL